MNEQQALAVIRATLDKAVKAGNIFENMDEAFAASNAFNLIAQTIVNKNNNATDVQNNKEN